MPPDVPADAGQADTDTRELRPVTPLRRARTRRAAMVVVAWVAGTALGVVLGRLWSRPSPPPPPAHKPPRLLPVPIDSVWSKGDPTRITVVFALPVEKSFAEATASYTIRPAVSLLAATLDADGRTVALTTAPLAPGVRYTLSAKGVRYPADEGAAATFVHVPTLRSTEGLVAYYTFEEGEGGVVKDRSGVGAPLHLKIADQDDVQWVPGGLAVRTSTRIVSEAPGAKITDACRLTNAITIEAWLRPANARQGGPARIVTLSKDGTVRNFTLGQEGRRYDVRLRTTTTGQNGASPSLFTKDDVATELHHVAYTRDAAERAAIYINGVAAASGQITGDLSNWQGEFRFGLANEIEETRTWLGELHLVAVYNRGLTPNEVAENFRAGPEGKTLDKPAPRQAGDPPRGALPQGLRREGREELPVDARGR